MKSESKMPEAKTMIHGQPSWRLATSEVEAFVTELGGQLGPVTFERTGRQIKPFSVAPWAEETFSPPLPPILQVLRGDFFCLPFGGNETDYRGEKHPIHGETANAPWQFESLENGEDGACLHLSLLTKIRPGRVDKKIYLKNGHNTVYCRHQVSGMSGTMNFGHHAMLRFPDAPGSGRISTSPFVLGQVFLRPFENPKQGGHSCLQPAAQFDFLSSVPMANGERADLSRFPARPGFDDLVMLVNEDRIPFAWTAVTFPKERYVWFALKDPRVLHETILWVSNGGRQYPPWNGRHVNVMGLEEVTAFFHFGLAESARKNANSMSGIPTRLRLNPLKPLTVNYIMGVARIPAGFEQVESIEAVPGKQAVQLRSTGGQKIVARADVDFLFDKGG